MPATHPSILEELRAHLGEWYPDLAGGVRVDLIDQDPRARSQLMRVRVVGPGAAADRTIILKHVPDEPVAVDERPRLVAPMDPADRLAHEFVALDLVARRFADLDDPGLGAVRPLGILPVSGALAMEAYDGRPLHQTLIPGFVRQSAELRAPRLVRRAGHWLRAFHDLPPDDRPVRQGTRSEVAAAFEAVGAFLAEHGAASDIDDVVRTGIRSVSRLPEPPPLAVCHGDFAPRNILIDATGRVAVIDISVRWLAPIYEDLASLLVALRMNRANALTRGMVFGPAVGRLEPAFFHGYFGGGPVPRAAIRVYELLLVLDKWSSRLSRASQPSGRRGLPDRAIDDHFAASSRLLARRLTRRG
jgi:aminoglycoside phosphotransferase (APT) family kinase protein